MAFAVGATRKESPHIVTTLDADAGLDDNPPPASPADVAALTADAARGRGASRAFYGVGLSALLGGIAYLGRGVLIPVVVSAFASFLIFTLKQTIRSAPLIGRHLPHWLCYLFAFLVITVFTILFVEIVANNVETLIEAWPRYETRLRALSRDGIAWLNSIGALPDDFVGGVAAVRSNALDAVNPILREVAVTARSLTANSVTILLYTVFMLLERGRMLRKVRYLFDSDNQRDAVNETISEIGVMVRQYITVKTLTNLITASVSYVIMRFVGVDFAGFWALLIFVLNFIPIVGAISAITLPVLLALVQPEGGGVRTAALALGLLVGAEQAMSSGIEPRLIGRSLNLSPLVILLSLAVWGAVWGFAGALLAVPITVTVMIVLTQFEPTRPIAILLSDSGQIAPIRHAPINPDR